MNQDSIVNRSSPTAGHRPWYITAVRVVRRFVTHQPLGTLGIVIFAALTFLAVFAPLLAPVDPQKPDRKAIFADYSDFGETGYLLGGDQQGRDLLSRLIFGARISLYVSVVATIAGVSIGTALGVISATSGGKVDLVIQRFIDAMMAFPSLILALAIRDYVRSFPGERNSRNCNYGHSPDNPGYSVPSSIDSSHGLRHRR